MNSPELLLPVGNLPMAIAAIHGGANAIYVGVPGFNARGRTHDFSLTELKELIDLCHLYGVKVHLAFNVLIFESELATAARVLEDVLPLGPDAFIVQDLGLVRMIREMAPSMRIHGSTQMTVTNDEAIRLMDDLSIQRFVLGRENSLDEIKVIRAGTQTELEVFVHGALCVAYSGQCFTSESLGGRSANRGQCAQSCRLGYELYVDGERKDLGDKKYLVSPQDLCGIEEVPELIKAGVDSFKVEGRLKGPEYVALTGLNYQAVMSGGDPLDLNRQREMATAYGRGFFSGWLHGVDHQRLVEGSFSSHRGFELGTLEQVGKDYIKLKSTHTVSAGQGLLFARGDQEVGAKIFKVTGSLITLLPPFDYSKLKVGMRVWVNSDDKLTAQVKKLTSDRHHMKRIPLNMQLVLQVGEATKLQATDPEGRCVIVSGAIGQPAQKPVDAKVLWDELTALGTTAYRAADTVLIGKDVYISQKDLKELRRSVVEAMNQARMHVKNTLVKTADTLLSRTVTSQNTAAKLNIVLREKAQVEDLVAVKDRLARTHLGVVFLDYEFGKDYASSVALLKANGFKAGIATTRILKPREYYNLNIILRAEPDAILVRNLGALSYLSGKGPELFGDFSLNVSNHLTAEYLLSKGLTSVCASYDLNQTQLQALLERVPREKLEVTLHQYMPEFHMEHCVFAAFMSTGSSFRDCGKPCEKHKVEMKDAYGNMHYLKADQECRNTLFRGSAQSAAFLKEKWQQGPGLWRFEALYERGEELSNKVANYLLLMSGEKAVADIIQQVGTSEKYGVTEGQLSVDRTWKDRKKDATV